MNGGALKSSANAEKSGIEKSITRRGSYSSALDISVSGAQTERRGNADRRKSLALTLCLAA
jgi:hypothetical protein